MSTFLIHWRKHILLIVLALLSAYFFLSALQGNAGLFRFFQLSAEQDIVQAQYDELKSEREDLDLLTRRLSDDYLDLDLLDEQARKRLGLVREDEVIIH